MKTFVGSAFSLSMLPTTTDPITLKVVELSTEDVKKVLSSETWSSCVGHVDTARVMSQLTGIEILPNRVAVSLQRGDQIVIFQLLRRIEEGRVLSEEEVLSIPHKWYMVTIE